MKQPKIRKVVWWACVGPRGIPVVFDSKIDAIQNRDEDERVARVEVRERPSRRKVRTSPHVR